MRFSSIHLATAICYLVHSTLAGDDPKVIFRDVAVIGGGAAGTYTAIQLQKLGKSVALIEKLGQLGGNVNTYRDPHNNETFDVGVVAYENISVVTDYLETLNVKYSTPSRGPSTTTYVDYKTGSTVDASKLNSGNLTMALQRYEAQLHRYPGLINGYNLPSTSSIPADFFLSWGDFIQKYNLQALAYVVSTYNQGIGNILDQPALYMLKYLDQGEVDQLKNGVVFSSSTGGNQQIYDNALAQLGSGVDAFTNSHVTSVKRTGYGVEISLTTPEGQRRIHARKLVIAVRPMAAVLEPFLDLRSNELALFKQWNTSYYWCGLVNNTGIPKNVDVKNADPSKPYSIPASPGLYDIGPTTLSSGLQTVYYSSPYYRSDAAVQAEILTTVARVRRALGYPAPSSEPSIAYWRAHRPFFLTVSEEAIRRGFYAKLQGLQGMYHTFWTGAAWQTEDSSSIWNYTKAVTIPAILRSLDEY